MFQSALGHRPIKLLQSAAVVAIYRLAMVALALLVVGAGAVQGQNRAAVHKVSPTYPPIAKQMRITGTVVVTTTVDSAGKVVKAESNSGNKLLAGSAVEAVKQWRFTPGEGNDTFPVSVVFDMDGN